MGTKLYVGNLPFTTDENALRAAFSQNGWAVTKVSIVADRETGRARGFAFVEMATEEQARDAMQALNGFELGGRPLRVSEAREERRAQRPSSAPRPAREWTDDDGDDDRRRGRGGKRPRRRDDGDDW